MGLKLGVNEPFRAALLKAEDLTGLEASALAAVIDAEAAKIGSGPKKGMWNSESLNAGSGAAGLTQFLASTWLGHAASPTHLLNAVGKEQGMVSSNNKVVANRKPDLLRLRFDPELSIVSAAEYGADNLRILKNRNVLPTGISDDERARYIYLAHHEGAGGAIGFLDGSRQYTRADLIKQVGKSKAGTYIAEAGGNPAAAYRTWFESYMDSKIVPSRFRDDSDAGPGGSALPLHAVSQPQAVAPMPAIAPGRAYVTTEGLNFRRAPDGDIIRSLTIGEAVEVRARIGNSRWYEVEIAGERGVVSGAYLRPPIAPAKEALLAGTVGEWIRFEKGRASEKLDPYCQRVGEMWQAIGLNYDGRSTYADGRDVPWSAAFISFVVRNAGPGYANFAFDQSHSVFVNAAIRARVHEQDDRPFWGYRISEKRPEIGDIIQRNRGSHTYSFDFAENHASYESHSDVVVEVRPRAVRVIGGNVGDTVSNSSISNGDDLQEYELDAEGFLRPGQRIIAVLKNRADQV